MSPHEDVVVCARSTVGTEDSTTDSGFTHQDPIFQVNTMPNAIGLLFLPGSYRRGRIPNIFVLIQPWGSGIWMETWTTCKLF
jgi:hypothetical protein